MNDTTISDYIPVSVSALQPSQSAGIRLFRRKANDGLRSQGRAGRDLDEEFLENRNRIRCSSAVFSWRACQGDTCPVLDGDLSSTMPKTRSGL